MAHRVEIAIATAITAVAAVLRLVYIGGFPPGLHGDEASFGLEARRVLEEGNLGAFTNAATGAPAGTFYWTAAFFTLFGDGTIQLRIAFALFGILTIPLTYAAFRVMFDRNIAVIGSLLLSVMAWHILFSRVAHLPIAWPFVQMGAVLALFFALKHESKLLFGATGLLIGFGVYTYGSYPIFAVAVVAFLVYLGAFHYRRRLLDLTSWTCIMAGAALFAGLPMASFAIDHPSDYLYRFRINTVTRTEEYKDGNLIERAQLFWDQEENFIRRIISEPIGDGVDAAGLFVYVNRLLQVLIVAGGAIAFWRWRSPAHAFLIIGTLVIGLGQATRTDAAYRHTIGMVPFLAGLAALPLALILERAPRWGTRGVAAGAVVVALAIGGVAAIDVSRYYTWYDDDPFARWVYAADLAEASEYMNGLPDGTYVYFYNDRHSFFYETRRFIAPDATGEDRSDEFTASGDTSLNADRSLDVAFIFMGTYVDRLTEATQLYPGGTERIELNDREGTTIYAAYFLPRGDGGPQPPPGPGQPTPTSVPPAGGEQRDETRQRHLVEIQAALEEYRAENGSYPDTGAAIQSLCVFDGLDAGCALTQVLSPLPQEPLGDPVFNGYWYISDGDSYTLYAQLESDQLAPCADHPDHLVDFEAVLCASGPGP